MDGLESVKHSTYPLTPSAAKRLTNPLSLPLLHAISAAAVVDK